VGWWADCQSHFSLSFSSACKVKTTETY
jgi:hypothetical protein